jgi:putative endonuclease
MNKKWSLYIIRCKDNSLYTGITTDVERRFFEHQNDKVKGAKYLRGKGPLQLVFKKIIGTKSEAAIMEYQIKKLPKEKKEEILTRKLLGFDRFFQKA